jgi:hypothetical protein
LIVGVADYFHISFIKVHKTGLNLQIVMPSTAELVHRITQMCKLAAPGLRVDQDEGDPETVSLTFRFDDDSSASVSWPVDWLAQKSEAEVWDLLQVRTRGRVSKPLWLDVSPKPAAFRVVYNSDLVIHDPADVATLCVFYDRVYLPYTSPGSGWKLLRNIDDWTEKRQASQNQVMGNEVTDWYLQYRQLFEKGVLGRLSPPAEQLVIGNDAIHLEDEGLKLWYRFRDRGFSHIPYGCGESIEERRLQESIERAGHVSEGRRVEWDEVHRLRPLLRMLGLSRKSLTEDLVKHLLRNDIDLPQIFVSVSGHPTRDLLIALEAKATFSYFLPKLQVHHPEQILELREKVADTREGFTMRLQELSEAVEERIKGGASPAEWKGYAESVVQTRLVPFYHEFKKQLALRSARKRDKVFDAIGTILEIDATIASPKFLGGVLKAFGLIESAAEMEEKLTNKYQAFKFMGEIEASASRLAG